MEPSSVAHENEERDSYCKANREISNIAYKVPSDLGRRNAIARYEDVLYGRDLIGDIGRNDWEAHAFSLWSFAER